VLARPRVIVKTSRKKRGIEDPRRRLVSKLNLGNVLKKRRKKKRKRYLEKVPSAGQV